MSDLIERLRKERSADVQDAADRLEEQELLIEAQQAEIAEYKKQIKQMGSSVQHYEHLAMKFSSQADVYSHDRQRAWAEIARLREALTKCHDTLHECTAVLTANDCATVAGVMAEARKALEQKP